MHRADAPKVVFESAGPQTLAPKRETFVTRAVTAFKLSVSGTVTRAKAWRQRTLDQVQEKLSSMLWGIERERVHRIASFLAVAFWMLSLVAVANWSPIGGFSLLALLLITAIISGLVAIMVVLGGVLAATFWLLVVAPVVVFAAFVVWLAGSFLVQAGVLAGRLSLLVPLSGFVAVTRAKQVWDGIFFTCPSRTCGYRGLPVYVCSSCGEGVRALWPNLYGLLYHECPSCGERLPALDRLGRRALERRCGGCEMPLMGRHAGRARERLVAIAGGTGSGKTNYLLMLVNEATNGNPLLRGEIDDDAQSRHFAREWRNLAVGAPAPKTSEVASAFLLYTSVGRERCQLYLYDAPGEEFASIGSMEAHQYFPLLEGIILLVDPLSFERVQSREDAATYSAIPLNDVVTSTLVTASAGKPPGRDGRVPLRVAVVISKADLESVRERVGDVRRRPVRGPLCREAIAAWGGESAIRAIEHRFQAVEYFACSPLGREVATGNRDPFAGFGVVEPLMWVLDEGAGP